MKYVSIDVETTGIDDSFCQVLEIGAIIEDTRLKLPFDKIPKFKRILNHKEFHGQAFAINMNQRIFKILAQRAMIKNTKEKIDFDIEHKIVNPDEAVYDLMFWLKLNGIDSKEDKVTITVAGKNFMSFDLKFLKKLPDWDKHITVRSRGLDPGGFSVDWENDEIIPSLDECMKRQGIEGCVSHDALLDAWDVIKVLRKNY